MLLKEASIYVVARFVIYHRIYQACIIMYINLRVPQIIAEGMKISMDANLTYFFCYYLIVMCTREYIYN